MTGAAAERESAMAEVASSVVRDDGPFEAVGGLLVDSACVRDDAEDHLVDEHGREPDQVKFYRMTHTHQDGTFVRDESRDLYERATSLIAERDDESAASTQQSRIEAEVFTELMGPERYGRVRGYGVGVTPTQLSEVSRYMQHAATDTQDSRVRRLETEIQKIRQSRAAEMEEMRQSRAEMQAMRG
ncbi:uncharacterized protein [Elaeis guineensis]|uniref:uncharacterized protein n=1 Tax=Elaeis guineensis var. tenera TaxID=51953 RepID=UPI003C6D62DC